MVAKRGILTVVVGLPGSGKSHVMEVLRTKATGIVSDDFFKNAAIGSPIIREPSVTDSRIYSQLIKDLRNGKRCVISDIIFCDSLMRHQLECAIQGDAGPVVVKWEYFENDPRRCSENAMRRNRKKTLARELKLIEFLSRKYFVPKGVKARKVYKEAD